MATTSEISEDIRAHAEAVKLLIFILRKFGGLALQEHLSREELIRTRNALLTQMDAHAKTIVRLAEGLAFHDDDED